MGHAGVGWGGSYRGGVGHAGGGSFMGGVGGSCRDGWVIQGWDGVDHAGVGWVMQGWGGVGHAGVGWVMQGWNDPPTPAYKKIRVQECKRGGAGSCQ